MVGVIAHRGASNVAPENTVRAIEAAVELGVAGVEIDVRESADGVPVVIHDATVDRTTDGSGAVGDHTVEELRALDAGDGEPVPTLDEALAALGPGTLAVVELKEPGLGAAVQYAEDHVGDEPFALLLGDNFIESSTPSIENLVDVAEDHEESVVALERIPWEEVPAYGIADVADTSGRSYPVDDLVEKPTREAAPSNLAIIGRYVFTPEIFDRLDETERSARGELELTDAMRELSAIRGTEIEGDRYHIGTVPDWLEANIRMALRHDDGQLNETVRRTG